MRLCTVECCTSKHWARGYCKRHYWASRLYGDPLVNKRRKLVEYNGQAKSITDWAKGMDITAASLSERLRSGWSIERALTERRGRFGPRRDAESSTLPSSMVARAAVV